MIANALILAAALAPFPGPADACTTVHMAHASSAVGKSFDYNIGYGLVVINKRGIEKVAMPTEGAEPVSWISEYASVSFNQYGVEMPHGGLNEAGLTVEQMWLVGTQYTDDEVLPAINELQWVQWVLDNHATVEEVIAAAADIRISSVFAPLHYLVCDESDACATFEYVEGELTIHSGGEMVVNTLTNDTYDTSVEYLEQFDGFGGGEPIPTSASSLDRFVRASALALEDPTEELPDATFSILDSVSQGPFSVWNIVYLPEDLRAYFRTYTENQIKSVDLAAFDLDCTAPTMILNIDPGLEGDVTEEFEVYTEEANRELLELSFADIIDYLPEGTIDDIATYHDLQECTLVEGDDDDDSAGDDDDDASADDDDDDDDDAQEDCSCTVSGDRAISAPLALAFLAICGWFYRRRR